MAEPQAIVLAAAGILSYNLGPYSGRNELPEKTALGSILSYGAGSDAKEPGTQMRTDRRTDLRDVQ